ncbi:DUF7674 family protein [Scatolibacter rhodanostii]|uniref:DUF7674 family protein n=1 Tax=Scatolibacter rhodanostii TaxID=2014781 RepID=UPI000C07C149|nr:hypothetical protein [Scatolibacter rhodanostii]
MDFNAFEIVKDKLAEVLTAQGFSEPTPLEDEKGKAVIFVTEDVAYSLLYNQKGKQFFLRSTSLNADKKPGDWRNLSTWLFDEADGTRADIESIANDFLEVVSGPKRVELVQQKKKKTKDDRSIDPLFFINRLANIFPELKEDIRNERITYGQIRFATFAKEKVAPLCDAFVIKYNGSSLFDKLCDLFSDMYENGDMDVRSILTISILNAVSNEAIEKVSEKVSEELKTELKYTRKLIGKNIKPEKKKKEKKVVDRLDK